MRTIEQFVEKNLFENVMNPKNNGMDSWNNYAGHDWSGWICGLIQTRDSETLEISNFESALETLGGEQEGKIEVREVGHWACGWFKQIMVNSQDQKSVQTLFEIFERMDNYPVLDEDDWSNREHENRSECAIRESGKLAEIFEETLGIKATKTLKNICESLLYNLMCRNGEEYYYIYGDLDKSTVRDLIDAMPETKYHYEKSRTFKKLEKSLGDYFKKMK